MLITNLRAKLGIMYKRRLERVAHDKLIQNETVRQILGTSTTSTGADYTDYWTLFEYIRLHKPQEILELGPGVTTAIMAEAVRLNGSGRITALEDKVGYYEDTKKNIPAHLRQFVDLLLVPSVEKRYGPFVGVGYENIPDRAYAFVLVDGPSYDAERSYNVDILDVIARSEKSVSAMIDTRTGSCFIYHLALGSKFRYSYLRKLGFIDGATKHDLKPYPRIVADAMKRHAFRRW